MTFAQCWWYHNSTQEHNETAGNMSANQIEEDSIYPLTTREIAEAQEHNPQLKTQADKEGDTTQLVKNITVLCKGNKMAVPKSLQHCAAAWYHHYLQHPGTKFLEETLCISMHWKDLRTTVQSYVKKCHSCQGHKCRQYLYGKLLTKHTIT
jgi:hypothetical protein